MSKKTISLDGFVNVNGKSFGAPIEVQSKLRPILEKTSFHKGFRVEGHPPGALENAKKLAEAETADFQRMRDAGEVVGKAPMVWNETYWRQNHKKKPVRAKPYEVPEAAKLCAELAVKAGWLDVVVTEIKREST